MGNNTSLGNLQSICITGVTNSMVIRALREALTNSKAQFKSLEKLTIYCDSPDMVWQLLKDGPLHNLVNLFETDSP
jgi:hypothetical protein